MASVHVRAGFPVRLKKCGPAARVRFTTGGSPGRPCAFFDLGIRSNSMPPGRLHQPILMLRHPGALFDGPMGRGAAFLEGLAA